MSRNERKQKDRQILESYQRVQKAMEHEGDSDSNSSEYTKNGTQKGNRQIGN